MHTTILTNNARPVREEASWSQLIHYEDDYRSAQWKSELRM